MEELHFYKWMIEQKFCLRIASCVQEACTCLMFLSLGLSQIKREICASITCAMTHNTLNDHLWNDSLCLDYFFFLDRSLPFLGQCPTSKHSQKLPVRNYLYNTC